MKRLTFALMFIGNLFFFAAYLIGYFGADE
jgi:hypothetical protein